MSSLSSHRHVAARLKDYWGKRTPWQRRLWNPGSLLLLREVATLIDFYREGSVQEASVRSLAHIAETRVGQDVGLGDGDARKQLQMALRQSGKSSSAELRYLTERMTIDYLERWKQSVDATNDLERVSRALGGHLLDQGFSPDHLHRWMSARENGISSLSGMLEEAIQLETRPTTKYLVGIPLVGLVPKSASKARQYISAEHFSTWLHERIGGDTRLRQSGGMLFEQDARDPWAAVEQAADRFGVVAAQVTVGLAGNQMLTPNKLAFVAGRRKPIALEQPGREVEVAALQRSRTLLDPEALPESISAALQLLAALENASPGAAIAGGWASVEAVLSDRSGPNVAAAERMSAIVACSFPRAELTTLSYRYESSHQDQLATSISEAKTNIERCKLLAEGIASQTALPLLDVSDIAATERMVQLLKDPAPTIRRIGEYVNEALSRLYRERNSVLHGARIGPGLRTALRTAPPLVGAGFDRIVHASLIEPKRSPFQLAAQAKVELDLAGGSGGRKPWELLE